MKNITLFMIAAMGLSCGAGSCTSKPSSGQQATDNDSLKNTVIASTQAVTTAATPKKLPYEKKGMFVENDTTFLYRYAKLDTFNNHVSYDYTDAYIETNRESKDWQTVKQRWSNFIYDEYHQETYDYELKHLHEKFGTPLPTHNCDEIKTTWVPFLSYRGKYYAEFQSSYYGIFINDSLYVQMYMDGPYSCSIQSAEKISPTHFRLQVRGHAQEKVKQQDIYIINPECNIAIFSSPNPERNNGKENWLYMAKESAEQLDLITWRSTSMPDISLIGYDEMNADSLLQNYLKQHPDEP